LGLLKLVFERLDLPLTSLLDSFILGDCHLKLFFGFDFTELGVLKDKLKGGQFRLKVGYLQFVLLSIRVQFLKDLVLCYLKAFMTLKPNACRVKVKCLAQILAVLQACKSALDHLV
jgi:hypothetical protein